MSLLYASSPPPGLRRTADISGSDMPPTVFLDASGSSSPEEFNKIAGGGRRSSWQHLYVLPVLLFEFLALALTRAVLPSILLQKYGSRTYIIMGVVEFFRGLLAFAACPLFGKISDVVGRRLCLFVTVLGTCAPVCSLAFFTWDEKVIFGGSGGGGVPGGTGGIDEASTNAMEAGTDGTSDESGVWPAVWKTASRHTDMMLHPHATTVFVVLLALSGIFSSTFTLVFAYISDTVRHQDERVSAYGLALATFGLSFTIGTFRSLRCVLGILCARLYCVLYFCSNLLR